MKNAKIFLVTAFLLGITLFSIFRYISAARENYYLNNNLKQIRPHIDSLEDERQNLLQTIKKQEEVGLNLSNGLKAAEQQLSQVTANLTAASESVKELNSRISVLASENETLKEEAENLNLQLVNVTKEKDSLQAKLGSISELKLAIRELKRKRRAHQVAPRVKISTDIILEGNRGYIIKDGKSTYPTKVKIEVIPTS